MVIEPGSVAVVIPTRGDVDIGPVLSALMANPEMLSYAISEIEVWDNSERDDLAVYGRYAAIADTSAPIILTQDDDCILPPESIAALLAAYQPGHVVCNMPERFREHYPDSALVGFGAVFDRDLPAEAFKAFSRPNGIFGQTFHRTCDVVFTTLTPRILVDVPVQILDYAHDDNRMWKQPGHVGERARMLQLARQVRDAVPA